MQFRKIIASVFFSKTFSHAFPLPKISQDTEAKANLISGKKVALAEDIEVLRHMQTKLDAFMKMLRKEKDGQNTPASDWFVARRT